MDKHESMRRKKAKRRLRRKEKGVVVFWEYRFTEKGIEWLRDHGYIKKEEVSNGEPA